MTNIFSLKIKTLKRINPNFNNMIRMRLIDLNNFHTNNVFFFAHQEILHPQ